MVTTANNLYYGLLLDGWEKVHKNHVEWFCHDFFCMSIPQVIGMLKAIQHETDFNLRRHFSCEHDPCSPDPPLFAPWLRLSLRQDGRGCSPIQWWMQSVNAIVSRVPVLAVSSKGKKGLTPLTTVRTRMQGVVGTGG